MVTQRRDGSVELRFFRPEARRVNVAGDFNGWHPANMPMARGADGWWRYELRLEPGYYQFRYIGDGEWYTDYAAFGLEHGPFGPNSVLKVDPSEIHETRTTATDVVRFAHISQGTNHELDALPQTEEIRTVRRELALAAV